MKKRLKKIVSADKEIRNIEPSADVCSALFLYGSTGR